MISYRSNDLSALAELDEALLRGSPSSSAESAVSVSELTNTLKDVVEGSFAPLWVRGEISDFKAHRNGHWYFCLRDAKSQIRCVVWSRDQRGIPAAPDDGMQVVVYGRMSVYAARGDVQLTITRMDAEGDGLWRKALEMTIAKLKADGLLDPDRKRTIPRFPRKVAVVTSPDGAALRDVIAVARRRMPSVEIIVVAAKVQGDGAADEIRIAIERVGRWREMNICCADVVIVGRGGGGREDLWAFNDERLARAIAACPIPVVSAVGHEVDITVCDLVADLRAATPSAAAEAVVPARADLWAALQSINAELKSCIQRSTSERRYRLECAARNIKNGAQRATERRRASLATASGRLDALSPLATLARGYAVARDKAGDTITSINQLPPDTPFTLTLKDGTIPAKSTGVSQ